jgi:hypothetical protein
MNSELCRVAIMTLQGRCEGCGSNDCLQEIPNVIERIGELLCDEDRDAAWSHILPYCAFDGPPLTCMISADHGGMLLFFNINSMDCPDLPTLSHGERIILTQGRLEWLLSLPLDIDDSGDEDLLEANVGEVDVPMPMGTSEDAFGDAYELD